MSMRTPAKTLDGKSLDIAGERSDRLRELFPEVWSEGKIDWNRLKAVLGEAVYAGKERYGISWAGKYDAFREIQKQTTATLIPDRAGSEEFDTSQNVFIEGENLEVLRVLQKAYYGKVKMIYIDPPYNTGSDSFVYPDDYAERREEYEKRAGIRSDSGFLNKQDLWKRNPEENGQFHSVWLSMMYPRLYLARNLLREDGVIFVSIDDNEVHNLRMLMNEVFGEENFIAQLTWEGAFKNDARQIGVSHEYVIVFARNRTCLPSEWKIEKEGVEPVLNEVDRLRKIHGDNYEEASAALAAWFRNNKATPSFALQRFRFIDKNGAYKEDDPTAPGGRKFNLVNPKTGEIIPLRANRGWAFDQAEFERLVRDGRISFVTDRSIMVRRYLHETDKMTPQSVFYQPARSASERLSRLMGEAVFDFPKDETVIQKFVEMATATGDQESVILDFFAGSGTTAHAVLDLNREDGGNRRFLCVQMPEPTDEASEAYKAGYRTIADIGRARIKKVIEKIKSDKNGVLDLEEGRQDLGFKAYKLQYSNFKVWRSDVEDAEGILKQLEAFRNPLVDGVADDREAILTEILLKAGIPLSSRIETVDTGDGTVFRVENGRLWVALDRVTPSLLAAAVEAKPQTFVCLGTLFRGENADEMMSNAMLELKEAGIEFKVI